MASGSKQVDNSQKTTSGTSTSTTAVNANPVQQAALNAAETSTQFSKDAAITDAQGAVADTIKTALQQGAPAIETNTKQSGGYNSTSAQLLGDDLTARAAAAGQKTLLDTITSYANAGAQQVNAASQAVDATKGTTATTTGNTVTGDSSTSGKGSVGIAAKPTVICTQLWRDGHLTDRQFRADNRYVRNHFSAATINGYRFWAVPFVHLMRRNNVAYAVGKYFGMRWSLQMASHYCRELVPNPVGIFLHICIVPLCFCLGSVIPDVEQYELWKGS